jgi:hypothetical protein
MGRVGGVAEPLDISPKFADDGREGTCGQEVSGGGWHSCACVEFYHVRTDYFGHAANFFQGSLG